MIDRGVSDEIKVDADDHGFGLLSSRGHVYTELA